MRSLDHGDSVSRLSPTAARRVKYSPMKSKSDFWLTLHKLASDLEREGETDAERAKAVCDVLNALTPATKAVYLANLEAVSSTLPTIVTTCNGK